MVLIIGGAYQGKLESAKAAFAITAAGVHTGSAGKLDFSKRCIHHRG